MSDSYGGGFLTPTIMPGGLITQLVAPGESFTGLLFTLTSSQPLVLGEEYFAAPYLYIGTNCSSIASCASWERKLLFLIHSPKSIKKYEAILGVDFREIMPDIGPKAEDSIAWSIAKKVTNFWKLVKGEIPDVKTSDWKMIK